MIDGWPAYYKKDLTIGDLESQVGLCTLWTEQKRLTGALDPRSYAVCGNLYSLWGINFILRNLLANPRIRYLIVCGADNSGSGGGLLSFFQKGVTEDYSVRDSRAAIHRQIPLEALELVRSSVRLIDLRGKTNPQEVERAISALGGPLPPYGEPALFPDPPAQAKALPSEKTGFKVEEATVAAAWLRLLKLVTTFGAVKPSEYGTDQKELLNVVAAVTGEDPDNVYYPAWFPFPFSPQELEDYYSLVVSPEYAPSLPGTGGTEVSYTYRDRLNNYRGLDSIEYMVRQLRESGHTRRAMAVLWDPLVDNESLNPPCLTELLASIQRMHPSSGSGQALYLTAHFRSHDIFGAWPQNAFALRRLQAQMAHRVNPKLKIGPLTVVSHSAHIYADKWPMVEELLEKHYPKTMDWRDDPRGNFHISLQDKKIILEHGTTEEGKTGVKFEGKTARPLYLAAVNAQLISLPEHAAYLGAELARAELALKLGWEYRQDRALPHKAPRKI